MLNGQNPLFQSFPTFWWYNLSNDFILKFSKQIFQVKFWFLSEHLNGGPGTLITSAPRQNYAVNYDYNKHYFMCPGSSRSKTFAFFLALTLTDCEFWVKLRQYWLLCHLYLETEFFEICNLNFWIIWQKFECVFSKFPK